MEELINFWESKNEVVCIRYIDELSKISFIPFVGAGMSVPFGFPSWSTFLSEILDIYFEEGEEKSEMKTLLNENKFLELADSLNQSLGEGFIEEQVRIKFGINTFDHVDEDKNYLSLMKTASISTFVTTNFDPVIESNLEIPAEKIYVPSNMIWTNDIEDTLRYREKSIIKLHGTANIADSIIITQQSFYNAYKSQNRYLVNIVEYLWGNSVLLFLGCGLKNDYLVEHLRKLAFLAKTNWHYAILPYPDNDLINFRRNLVRLKIRPIWFEEGKFYQINLILKAILKDSTVINEYKDILIRLNNTMIEYKRAIRNSDENKINNESECLNSIMYEIDYFREKNTISNSDIAQSANKIIKQYNKYVCCYYELVDSLKSNDPKYNIYISKTDKELYRLANLILSEIRKIK